MTDRLTWRQRLILDMVRENGDPHILDILRSYPQRSGEPLEPANIGRILDELVRDGFLRVERRPLAGDSPSVERDHFIAIDQRVELSQKTQHPITPPSRPSQFLEILQFLLQESPDLKLARAVAEHSESS